MEKLNRLKIQKRKLKRRINKKRTTVIFNHFYKLIDIKKRIRGKKQKFFKNNKIKKNRKNNKKEKTYYFENSLVETDTLL